MKIIIKSETIYITELDFALELCFVGKFNNKIETIVLQRALFKEDDEPGSKGIYFERNEQEFAGYDVVKLCHLQNKKIILIVNENEIKHIGGWSYIEIHYNESIINYEKLYKCLKYIFSELLVVDLNVN